MTSRFFFGKSLDQDFTDSANGFWSVWLFSICSMGAFFIRYAMHPISCWVPSHFEDFQAYYATRTCFQNSHFIPFSHSLGEHTPTGTDYMYLWVPMLLALQALGFKLPNVIWRTCRHYLTVDIDDTVASLKASQIYNQDNRTLISNSTKVLRAFLKRNKFFLSILYLVVKFLYCVNLAVQFTILTVYIKPALPVQLLSTNDSSLLTTFPKTVLCTFGIRHMGNVQHYTVQCTLHITEVYEKMYLFLWFWLLLLIFITNLNLLVWLGHFFIPFLRDSRISVYINSSSSPSADQMDVNRFVNDVLGIDGIFFLTMISRNSSDTIASDLVQEMFHDFQTESQKDVGHTSYQKPTEINV